MLWKLEKVRKSHGNIMEMAWKSCGNIMEIIRKLESLRKKHGNSTLAGNIMEKLWK